jgi:hypothetical protein
LHISVQVCVRFKKKKSYVNVQALCSHPIYPVRSDLHGTAWESLCQVFVVRDCSTRCGSAVSIEKQIKIEIRSPPENRATECEVDEVCTFFGADKKGCIGLTALIWIASIEY